MCVVHVPCTCMAIDSSRSVKMSDDTWMLQQYWFLRFETWHMCGTESQRSRTIGSVLQCTVLHVGCTALLCAIRHLLASTTHKFALLYQACITMAEFLMFGNFICSWGRILTFYTCIFEICYPPLTCSFPPSPGFSLLCFTLLMIRPWIT